MSGRDTCTSYPSRRIISIRIESCSSPRPITFICSGESVSSTRSETLPSSSFSQPVAQVARGDVLPVPAGHRRRVDPEDHRHRRLVDGDRRNPDVVLGVADRFADGDALDAGDADDVAGGGLLDLHALQAIEGKQLGDLGLLDGPTELQHRHRAVQLHGAVEHAADRDPSEIVARVQIGHQDLQRRRRDRPWAAAQTRRWRRTAAEGCRQAWPDPSSRCRRARSHRAPEIRSGPRWHRGR